jgi:hypothetical protein
MQRGEPFFECVALRDFRQRQTRLDLPALPDEFKTVDRVNVRIGQHDEQAVDASLESRRHRGRGGDAAKRAVREDFFAVEPDIGAAGECERKTLRAFGGGDDFRAGEGLQCAGERAAAGKHELVFARCEAP